MTRALLVRHGQSEWNAVGRWQGQADPPLSDLGRHQARLATRTVGTVDAVVASDLQRASETAMIVAGELGVGPVVIDPDWRERDAGEWSGLTRAEIEEQWPGYLPETRSGFAPSEHEEQRRPPSWEGDEPLLARALAALSRVHELVGDGDVLVVTHGGLIYTVEQHLGAPFERIANLAGRWVDVDGGGLKLGDRVHLVDPHDETVPAQL
jgi:probable phosphoglycerate mutase